MSDPDFPITEDRVSAASDDCVHYELSDPIDGSQLCMVCGAAFPARYRWHAKREIELGLPRGHPAARELARGEDLQ